jgi:hypothetical protein
MSRLLPLRNVWEIESLSDSGDESLRQELEEVKEIEPNF